MQKIVINTAAEFRLSLKAKKRYLELCGKDCYFYRNYRGSEIVGTLIDEKMMKHNSDYNLITTVNYGKIVIYDDISGDAMFFDFGIARDDKNLVRVIEEMGEEANGYGAELKIAEIPDGVEWEIKSDKEREWVSEKHRTWGKEESV